MFLVTQDHLLKYMQHEFCFGYLSQPGKIGDSIHFHAYSLATNGKNYTLNLALRLSTDTAGVAACLGLQANSNVEMEEIIKKLEQKISTKTLMTL
jgi:carbonic anhydrase